MHNRDGYNPTVLTMFQFVATYGSGSLEEIEDRINSSLPAEWAGNVSVSVTMQGTDRVCVAYSW